MAIVITFPAADGAVREPSPARASQGGTPLRFTGIVAAIFLLQFVVVWRGAA